MSEISKINFSLQGAEHLQKRAKSEENQEKKAQVDEGKNNKAETKQVSSDKILDAMELSAKNNLTYAKVKGINPRDYLSEERIKEIENSMQVFEKGVQKHSAQMEREFSNVTEFDSLSQADKLALSAKSFAIS